MSLRGKTTIVGCGETPVDRLGRRPGEQRRSSAEYLAWAAKLAMEDAGLTKKDLEGQGLAAIYTTTYGQPFWPLEAADILGISPSLLIGGGSGGASAVSMVGQATAAISSDLVDLVLCVAASAAFVESFPSVQPGDTRTSRFPTV